MTGKRGSKLLAPGPGIEQGFERRRLQESPLAARKAAEVFSQCAGLLGFASSEDPPEHQLVSRPGAALER